MPTAEQAPTRCFISYKREDNTEFDGVVDKLKLDLAGRFHAYTGRTLEIFVDRDDIGWGQDWRQRIRESVEAATVFIPVVTMRYFTSGPCREELLAFHSNANQLGVTDLLLPVVLTGSGQISADDPRDEVRLIERLNYRSIESAWLAGYDSPEWRKIVFEMVRSLSDAVLAAESKLVAREAGSPSAAVPGTGDDDGRLSGSEDGVGADVSALHDRFDELTARGEQVLVALNSFATAAGESMSGDMGGLSTQQQRARLIAAAGKIAGPARSLEEKGALFEQEVADADATLRQVVTELLSIDLPEARDQVAGLVSSMAEMGDVQEIMSQMDGMVQMLKFASLVNVSLRRAVQPGIRGVQALKNAFATVESWKALA